VEVAAPSTVPAECPLLLPPQAVRNEANGASTKAAAMAKFGDQISLQLIEFRIMVEGKWRLPSASGQSDYTCGGALVRIDLTYVQDF
jgi:hypothetical protein